MISIVIYNLIFTTNIYQNSKYRVVNIGLQAAYDLQSDFEHQKRHVVRVMPHTDNVPFGIAKIGWLLLTYFIQKILCHCLVSRFGFNKKTEHIFCLVSCFLIPLNSSAHKNV